MHNIQSKECFPEWNIDMMRSKKGSKTDSNLNL